LDNVLSCIRELKSTGSSIAKKKIVLENYEDDLVTIFQKTYNDTVFHVKKIKNSISDFSESNSEISFFVSLLNMLTTRKVTGDAAQAAIHNFCMNHCTKEVWNEVFFPCIKKDLKCGFTSTLWNTICKSGDEIVSFSPMGVVSSENPSKFSGKKIVQKKYDGVRGCIFVTHVPASIKIISRNGKPYKNFKKIEQALLNNVDKVFEGSNNNQLMIDCEIISSNFQTLSKQLQRKDDIQCDDASIVIFDCIEGVSTQVPLHSRLERLKRFEGIDDCIQVIESDVYENQPITFYQQMMEKYCSEGLEGVVVKTYDSVYEYEKSISWIKIKKVDTIDLQIVDIVYGAKGTKTEHVAGAILVEGIDNGKFFKISVGGGLSDDLRKDLMENKESYIGKTIEIKFDSITKAEGSSSYSVRFPRFFRFRFEK
jgi:hypothetical protein